MKNNVKKVTDNELNSFEKIANSLYDYIKLTWDVNVNPKGYKEFMDSYEEGKGYDEVDNEKIQKEFNGINDTTVCSPPFPFKIEISNVAYDDKEQGRNPLQVLIGAILSYGMTIGEERTKRKLKKEFEDKVKFLKMAMKNLEY